MIALRRGAVEMLSLTTNTWVCGRVRGWIRGRVRGWWVRCWVRGWWVWCWVRSRPLTTNTCFRAAAFWRTTATFGSGMYITITNTKRSAQVEKEGFAPFSTQNTAGGRMIVLLRLSCFLVIEGSQNRNRNRNSINRPALLDAANKLERCLKTRSILLMQPPTTL